MQKYCGKGGAFKLLVNIYVEPVFGSAQTTAQTLVTHIISKGWNFFVRNTGALQKNTSNFVLYKKPGIFVSHVKRFFVILLLVAYLIPAIGVSVSAHYCEDQLDSITFGGADEQDCPCELEAIDNDCCKDITIFIHSDDAKQIAAPLSINYFKIASKELPVYITTIYNNKFLSAVNFYTNYLHPPNCNHEQSLYLTNQVFRI